jgi:hypothetical protein
MRVSRPSKRHRFLSGRLPTVDRRVRRYAIRSIARLDPTRIASAASRQAR